MIFGTSCPSSVLTKLYSEELIWTWGRSVLSILNSSATFLNYLLEPVCVFRANLTTVIKITSVALLLKWNNAFAMQM